jgi:hypothetical protein
MWTRDIVNPASFIARKKKKLCLIVNLVRSCEHLKLGFHTMSPKMDNKRQFQLRSSCLFCFPVSSVEITLQIVKINISMTSLLIQFYHEPRQLGQYCDWLPTGSQGFRSRHGHSYFYSRNHRSSEAQLTSFPVYTSGNFRSKVAMTSV